MRKFFMIIFLIPLLLITFFYNTTLAVNVTDETIKSNTSLVINDNVNDISLSELKNKVDYTVNLKIGQKLSIISDVSFGYETMEVLYSTDDSLLTFDYNDATFIGQKIGEEIFNIHIGSESKLFHFIIEENINNETLPLKILEITANELIKIEDFSKDNVDYYIEMNVGETYDLQFENFKYFDIMDSSQIHGEHAIINFVVADNSKLKFTGLREGKICGYLEQRINPYQYSIKSILILVNNQKVSSTDNMTNDNTNTTNNSNNSNITTDNPNTNQNTATKILLKEVLIIPPTKRSYKVGENLDLDGLKITAVYDNNSIKEITKDYTVTGYNKNKEGKQTVKISYKGFSRSYIVQVGNSSINIDNSDKLPQTGDFFDLKDGLYLLCIISTIILVFIIFKSLIYNKRTK